MLGGMSKEKILEKILELFAEMPDKENEGSESQAHEMGEAPKEEGLEIIGVGADKPDEMKKEMC